MKKLYKFRWDCRYGTIEGTFVADEQKVADAIGEYVYFGDILGKHSEVSGNLCEGDLTVVTDDADFIERAIEYGIDSTGYNPLGFIEEGDEEDDEADEEDEEE